MLSCHYLDRCVSRRSIPSPLGRLLPRSAVRVLALASILATAAVAASGQEPTSGSEFSSTVAEPPIEKLREQIQQLASPSYRSRQLAIWYLEQNAARALPLLREAGQTTDLNIGAEIVALLSWQAMASDPTISVAAHEALKEIAGGERSVTAVSYLANSALEGIADRQEILAQRSLEDLNVEMGALRLTIGGAMQNDARLGVVSNIVHITDDFTGDDEDIRLFRFLRSYDTAFLEGDKVSEPLLREILAMPGLKRVVLKGPKVDNELLTALFDCASLEHLELTYTNVDDSAIDTIVDLPLVDSLRLFGTKISAAGADRIKKELDGLDIYFGRGGFLGVQNSQSDLTVSKVVPGSGAEKGGIEAYDEITHVNDKPVKTFVQLREELANYAAGEQVTITVKRRTALNVEQSLKNPDVDSIELKLPVTLGEQESSVN